MKRTSLMMASIVMAGALFFTSCTKKLKDDVRDLKQRVDSLQKHNNELEDQVGGIENMVGSNEPITVTTRFEDDNGATKTITDVYRMKSVGAYTQQMQKNSDGTYHIYIERFGTVDWQEAAWVQFLYNPATKAITEKRGGHYWDNIDPYNDNIYYDETYGYPGLTMNIDIKKIDLNTGDISLTFTAQATADYTNALYSGNSPNPGKPVNTSFSFTGRLELSDTN